MNPQLSTKKINKDELPKIQKNDKLIKKIIIKDIKQFDPSIYQTS